MEECSICSDPFDEREHRPKVLPCGHTYCLKCLQHRGFGNTCPMDRKAFQGSPADIPDNFQLLNRAGSGPSKSRFWCQNCNGLAVDGCLENGHRLCTLRQMRAEQVEVQVQQLQLALVPALQLGQIFKDVDKDLRQQLKNSKSQLKEMKETLEQLQQTTAAEDEGDDSAIQRARQAASDLVKQLPQLLDDSWLLSGQGDCSILVEADSGATSWTSIVPFDPNRGHILKYFLLDLLKKGMLIQQHEEKKQKNSNETEDDDMVELDMSQARSDRPEWFKTIEELLHEDRLEKVRKVVNLDCAAFPVFSRLLLHKVAPRVEELKLVSAEREHLEAIRVMPKLRKLHLELASHLDDAPPLPEQLSELHLVRVSEAHLLSVQRMPLLRSLTLINGKKEMVFPSVPPGHSGLQSLTMVLYSPTTMLSLIRAHAATLRTVEMTCTSERIKNWYMADLADRLGQCGLVKLERLVLVRETLRPRQVHDLEACREQVAETWDRLVRRDDDGQIKAVSVLCSRCCEM